MRKFLFFFGFFVLIVSNVFSQWKSSDIPDSLKQNSNIVFRRYATEIKVLGFNSKIVTINKVITVLNEKGKNYANFSLEYDKNSIIESFKGILYNDVGKIVKKITIWDLKDQSIIPEYTLYADNREKFYELFPSSYPFTVEYEYRVVVNNILSFPTWYPQFGYNIAVEEASLKLNLLDSNLVRFKTFNISKPEINKKDKYYKKSILWEIKNLKPILKEPFSPMFYDSHPAVFMAPNNFIFEGYEGTMKDWQSYGEWVGRLLEGRQDLSNKAVEEIQRLTSGIEDTKEKVRVVYKFLQAHTRYVSVQLGIGGYQPFPASNVEKYGYGDCKALTNYTKTLLSSIGIESYYCEIGVSSSRITFSDFPSISQTDHVFLCVPIKLDTVWLECTNQNFPFGFVSYEKQNQKAILVNGSFSRLVNLPKADPKKNIQQRKIVIQIDSLGNAVGNISTEVFGAELENLMPEIWSSKKDQAEIIQRKYRIPSITFIDFNYMVTEALNPFASEKIMFKADKLASITGKRLFIPFNSFASVGNIPAKSKKRICDVEIDQSFTHLDTVVYKIPKGYNVEFIPKPKLIEGLFGDYESKVIIERETITTIRKYRLNRNKYPAVEYNNFVSFLSEVAKSDKQSIVLVLKQ